MTKKLYLFIIDTNEYAGNFERDICAYITGQVGECGVGEENAELARKEVPDVVAKLEKLVESVPDEHGCHRPCSIYPTSGWFNHGMGGHFKNGQEKEALINYRQEVKKYHSEHIKSIQKVKDGTNGWTENTKKREIKRHQDKIDEATALKKVSKYPAYMSVAIYLNSIPDTKLLETMKERARTVASRGIGMKGFENKITIEGFRLVKQQTMLEELKI